MTVKLLTEHHLEFLRLKGEYTGSSESTLFKMAHCWKSHVGAIMYFVGLFIGVVHKDCYYLCFGFLAKNFKEYIECVNCFNRPKSPDHFKRRMMKVKAMVSYR